MLYVREGRSQGINWKYVTTSTITFKFDAKYSIPCEFKNEWIWIRMEDDNLLLTVNKNYAWDGCSFVPDFKGTIIPSLAHDAIYQFMKELSITWNISMYKVSVLADKLFFESMKKQKRTAKVIKKSYYIGARLLGFTFKMTGRFFRKLLNKENRFG
jgi:hypothetical protein